ncbi:MAG: translation initiation factor IF-2 [Eubacteriales bacterium]|nr:translation initiation factor IF-2 [Eubacteriales bacterium]
MAEDKTSGADAKKAAADGKKPAKKKKIIIVTGGNTQGGQRGAYSSGSGAYNPGGAGGFRSGGTRGGKAGSPAGSGTGGGRPRQRNDGKGERPAGQNRDGGRRQSGAGRGRTQAPPVHKLIKPTIRQTQMEVDFHKPVQQPRKADNVKKAEAEAAAAREAAAAQEAAAAAAKEAEAAKAPVPAPATEAKAPAPVSEARPEPAREAAASEKKTPQAESQSAPQKKDAGSRGGRAEGGSRQQRGGARADQPGRQGAGGRDGGSAPRGGRGGRPGQGADNRGGRGGNDARGGRPGQGGPGAGGRPGQGPAPAGRGGDKGRKQPHQDKDRRSRKDQIYNEEENSRRNKPGRFNRPEKKEQVPVEEQIKTISVPEKISIRDLAERMHLQAAEIIKKLFLQGKMMTPNSEVSYEEAEEIALGYEILCEKEQKVDVIEELLREDEEDEAEMVSRPPVICVMGHVDHGKTSLLDAIRSTNVTGKEAGGITQAIGAYMVSVNGRDITFLDTPGHEAFTAMRMRGANSTDIAILVVAADDGVMPQTIEAINHAKAAGVEIVVAINKIDKDGANPERVKQELTEYELVPTEWGGSTEFVEVSAKTGDGIEDLLETILLTADIMELKANPDRKARGLVLEAKLDKGRGPVANVLVQKGTLHIGDFISAGASSGKVRAMIDDKGRRVKVAKPSHPVEILGLSDVPSAGEVFLAHEDLQTAKSYAETYKVQRKEELIEETRMRMNLDDLFNQMKEGNLKEFNLILKADVQGSVEALRQSLLKLSNEEVVVKVIHAGVGNITESDVSLASASNAVIIGFNVRPDMMAKSIADQEHVDIRLYKVIYQAIDAIEAALKGMLAPIYEERVIGHAQVRMLFKASHVGNIAGSMVIDGVIRRGCKVRIKRGSELIYEGSLASLKRFKDDAKEVREGFECGLVFDGFDKMQVDDIVEAYDLVEVPRD